MHEIVYNLELMQLNSQTESQIVAIWRSVSGRLLGYSSRGNQVKVMTVESLQHISIINIKLEPVGDD